MGEMAGLLLIVLINMESPSLAQNRVSHVPVVPAETSKKKDNDRQ